MKVRALCLACAAALCLCACGSAQSFLSPYSEMDIVSSSDVLSLVDPEKTEGFASDLAVISVEDDEASIEDDTISTSAALLIQTDTNEVIYSKNVYESLAPASLTKLMTALLILKYADFEDEITITQEMLDVGVSDAQMAGFSVGDTVSVEDLFYVMLIYSGNDTSNALAIYLSGSVDDFAELMNEEAQSLGATHSNFVNACGLDADGHETCAYDLYLIFRECLKYDRFCDVINRSSYTAEYTSYTGEAVSMTWYSTNQYLTGIYSPPDGVYIYGGKTGTTSQAGSCLILYTTDTDGQGYISLILGGTDSTQLYTQMSQLLSMID